MLISFWCAIRRTKVHRNWKPNTYPTKEYLNSQIYSGQARCFICKNKKAPRWSDSLKLKSEAKQSPELQWAVLHQVMQVGGAVASPQPLSHQHGPQHTFSAIVLKIYFEKGSFLCFSSKKGLLDVKCTMTPASGHWSPLMPESETDVSPPQAVLQRKRALLLPLEREEENIWTLVLWSSNPWTLIFFIFVLCLYAYISVVVFRLATFLSWLWLFLGNYF